MITKVLHINTNYIGTTLHQLMIRKLGNLGVENSVFVPTYDKKTAVIVPDANVCVSECFKKWDRLFFDYKQNKIFKSIQECYDISGFECIHAYTLFTDGNCARNLSKKYEIPYVVAVRNTDVNDFFRLMPHLRSRGVKIMRDARAVFFLSESYRKDVFEKYVPAKYREEILKKTHIIPNGIDDFWFENAPEIKNVPGNTVKLLYAGRIDKNKNIPTTQKAMSLLREKGYSVELTVVGKVADKKEFEYITQDSYTTYVPAQPKEKLVDLYRQHNVFVMPSFTESFGLVYAEAMSQGLPVVYSEGQGFDRQFEEGMVGYHVSPNNPESVANGIERVIDSFALIQNNVVDAARKFKWDDIVQGYLQIYKKIV